MRLRIRALFSAPAMLVGVLLCSGNAFAQGGAVDCSKPLADVPKDWMNTEYLSDTNPGGFKSINAIAVEADRITIESSFGSLGNTYVFNAKDIKSITKGDYDDGLYPIAIDVPFQFSNSAGAKTAPPGMTQVTVAFPEEVADQAIAGLLRLRQKAVCGK